MPILKFRLRNRRLILDAGKSTEEWELIFSAVNQPVQERQSFRIFVRERTYDAYSISGNVYIRPRVAGPLHPSLEREDSVGSVAVTYDGQGEFPPSFEANFWLSEESFRRLLEFEVQSLVVELWVTTATGEKGLIYGGDPDGRQLEWWPERSNISMVEEISVRFIEPQP